MAAWLRGPWPVRLRAGQGELASFRTPLAPGHTGGPGAPRQLTEEGGACECCDSAGPQHPARRGSGSRCSRCPAPSAASMSPGAPEAAYALVSLGVSTAGASVAPGAVLVAAPLHAQGVLRRLLCPSGGAAQRPWRCEPQGSAQCAKRKELGPTLQMGTEALGGLGAARVLWVVASR